MRAMVLEKPEPVEKSPLKLEDVTQPLPLAGEVRVKVSCCAVCHTDLHIAEGELNLPRLPLIPGHQTVGVVELLGAGVKALKEGDRVGIPWLHSTDGSCSYCRHRFENLCENARFTGLHNDGGYAEYTTAREDFVFPLPKSFPDENAAPLLCAGIVGFRSYRISGASSGDHLGLYGFGASAHLVMQVALYEGCQVSVFTRAQSHREMAKRLGAAWVGSAEESPPDPLDAAIMFAPSGALVPLALKRLRKGGVLSLAGITMSPIPQMDYSLLYGERVVRSVANNTRQDSREFLEIAARVPLKTEIQMFELEQANEALQALKKSETNGAAVLRVASSA